jgi:outer membrane protein insertion porin family
MDKKCTLILRAVVLGFALISVSAKFVVAQAPGAGDPISGAMVRDISVRGNSRIDANAIRAVSALQTGQKVSGTDIQNAIRRLMATRNYEAVNVLFEGDPTAGGTLVIEVTERPLIASLDIQGLERVSASSIRDTINFTANQPLNPQTVVRAERLIRDRLAAQGVQLASLDTTLVAVPDQPGVYQLIFNVREGNRLAIAEVDFVGNQNFSAEDLRGAIKTKKEGFLWFREGKYDRTTFQEDLLVNLPKFYGSHGYIDFNVVSDTLEVDPVSGKARLIVTVNEGPQYRLGEFAIQGAQRFPQEQLQEMWGEQRRSVLGLPFGRGDSQETGEVFDQAALDEATARVQQLYRNEGYLYAQVDPVVERRTGPNGERLVDVTWSIIERSPFYINTVTIEGNTFTHESVIRDRVVVYPGDVYSEDRLIQSYRSIAALGFFETPLPNPGIFPNQETGTVDLVFTVQEKQTGSINFGTSVGGGGYGRAGGVSGFLGYSQPNLFGQAKQANLQAEYGFGRSSFTASFTDPALFGTRNSGSVSLFHTDDRYRGFSFTEGRYVRTGGSVRYGFPLLNFRWARAFAGYSISKYSYEAREEDECDVGNIFCQPSAVASTFTLAVTRDTKDHPMFPSVGTRQNIQLQQTGGPLGGDGNFQKLTGDVEWWTPVAQFGGGTPGSRPIIMTFGMLARGGAVFGDASRFPLERFFLGGTQFGQPLRGYEESTLTPFGFFDRDDPRVASEARLGDAFFSVTGEYAVRLSDMISISLFGDAGNIWNNPASINPSQLYRSLGVGATVITPFGPLGIDYAYGFDRNPPAWQLHFKISQPGQ